MSEVRRDSGGLEILTEEECRKLLETRPVGRIVFTDQALPAVQPVNFAVSAGQVIIRTVAGSKLAAAARGSVVAFEVDDFDPEMRTGWSVVLVGHARVVADGDELARLRSLPLRSWTPGRRDHYIAITPKFISGRRIPAGEASRIRLGGDEDPIGSGPAPKPARTPDTGLR